MTRRHSDLDTSVDLAPPSSSSHQDAERPTALAHALPPTRRPRVEIGEVIGRGGMAVVHAGVQNGLDRAVAVKVLDGADRSARGADALAREARIMSRLEHPNIVPVYDVVAGPGGSPQVVMKRIEGETWAELMDDAEAVRSSSGVEDLLEWNLGVLMTVAQTLSFVHDRGYLHRDVKPSNVMIGRFGEVYLVDWGVACELSGERPGLERELAGTWSYAAPEQLAADASLLGPWTDTYLLGATLFQILTGHPPHAGKTLEDRLAEASSVARAPALPEGVPSQLAQIVLRALDPVPETRTRHPRELRAQLAMFLRRRGALRMVARGESALARARLATSSTSESSFQEAVFAFRMALEEWPKCEEARSGLSRLAEARIAGRLAAGDVAEAQRLLEAEEGLPAELVEAVRLAGARKKADAEALERMVADSDRSFGHATRGVFGVAVGALWIGFWAAAATMAWPAAWLALFTAGFGAVAGILVAFRGPQLLEGRFNRTTLALILCSLVTTVLWCVGAAELELAQPVVLGGLLLVWAMFAGTMAAAVDRWALVSFGGFAAAFLVGAFHPPAMPWALIASNLVLVANHAALNWSLARRGFVPLPRPTTPAG